MAVVNAEGADYYQSKPLWFALYEQKLKNELQEIKDSLQETRGTTQMAAAGTFTEQNEMEEAETHKEHSKQDLCPQEELKIDVGSTKKQEKSTLLRETINLAKYFPFTMIFSKFEDQNDYQKFSNILIEYLIKSPQEEKYQCWVQTCNSIFNKNKNRLQPLKEMLQFITDNFKIKN